MSVPVGLRLRGFACREALPALFRAGQRHQDTERNIDNSGKIALCVEERSIAFKPCAGSA